VARAGGASADTAYRQARAGLDRPAPMRARSLKELFLPATEVLLKWKQTKDV
jgi:hypothetical protein